ncbi:MAG: PEP-CTERM sorting domain-containing protein [Candidatus Acidiferrales bacterium]
MRIATFAVTALAALSLLGTAARADNIVVTYGAPGVQTPDSAIMSGATVLGTETFSTQTPGYGGFTTTYGTGGAITGTYSSGAYIHEPSQYGGAGGTGQFVDAIGGTSGYTITLTTSSGTPGVNYFGYWLSALDAGNELVFLENGTQVGTFTPADLIAALGPCTGSNPYCGNPNAAFLGQDSAQPYAFVNFVDTTGYFNEIEVFEDPDVGSYESDNHTVAYCSDPQACISGNSIPSSTPEPSSIVLLGTGLLGLLAFLVRRQRHAPMASH